MVSALFTLVAGSLAAQDAPPPFVPFTAEETARFTALGKQATRYFFEGKADSLLGMIDSSAVEGVGGLDGIRGQMDRLAERAGVVVKVEAEMLTRRMGNPQWWHEASFSDFTQEPIVMRWVFNTDGKIVGAGMGPKSGARRDPGQN
jgi:hypothetical protein